MTPLTALEVADVLAAVTGPISDNFVSIVTILAGVAGLKLVYSFIKRSAK